MAIELESASNLLEWALDWLEVEFIWKMAEKWEQILLSEAVGWLAS